MPYIKESRRQSLNDWARPSTPGELNYVVTQAVIDYICQKLKGGEEFSYQMCHDVVGALENAKNEFQRRVQHPYEDQAMERNGDVYESLFEVMKRDLS